MRLKENYTCLWLRGISKKLLQTSRNAWGKPTLECPCLHMAGKSVAWFQNLHWSIHLCQQPENFPGENKVGVLMHSHSSALRDQLRACVQIKWGCWMLASWETKGQRVYWHHQALTTQLHQSSVAWVQAALLPGCRGRVRCHRNLLWQFFPGKEFVNPNNDSKEFSFWRTHLKANRHSSMVRETKYTDTGTSWAQCLEILSVKKE